MVGAGPGDPGLLTLRGRELLEQADVVIFDRLISPRLKSFAPAAQWIFAGKQAAEHSMSQEQINGLLIEHAQAGKRVVRLKGGDPFVFGRGGEECEALAAAGVAFEVVPGITAAIAAAAYAGIPVTHRDFNSSFTLITGHEKEDEYRDERAQARGSAAGSSDLDWIALAKLPCVAFYMGVKSLPRITLKLIEHGMAGDTPAACIQWGTTPRQRTIVGTVADIADRAASEGIGTPAMTIVGRVVALRNTIRWFDTRPLFGRTIVVTRTRQQASELSAKLEQLGANVIEAPTIELFPQKDMGAVDSVFCSLSRYAGGGLGRGTWDCGFSISDFGLPRDPNPKSDAPRPSPGVPGEGGADWLLFTSPNAVEFTRIRLFELHLDTRIFAGLQIAVIGDATKRAVENQLCCRVDLCPDAFIAEALANALRDAGEVRGKRFLLLRADIARPVLFDRLRADGAAEVVDLPIYETRRPDSLPPELLELLDAKQVDWITFASSSSARNLIELLGETANERLTGVKLASIGPITSQTLRELGHGPTVEASPYNLEGLVAAISNTLVA